MQGHHLKMHINREDGLLSNKMLAETVEIIFIIVVTNLYSH